MKFAPPPKLTLATLGPGLVLIALGLGAGEFILWPSLIATYGFGVLAGAIVGITCQYFINTESLRYPITTGASVYVGLAKLNKYIPIWFITSTFSSFMWPGIIGSAGVIMASLFGLQDPRIVTVIMLLVIGFLLSFGGKVYNRLEKIQKTILLASIPFLLIIAILLADLESVGALFSGLLGIGDGYFVLPAGISLLGFLGAVAYSGAAGNLVISSSFYVQDKGYGMASQVNAQIDRNNKKKGLITEVDQITALSDSKNLKSWFNFASREQLISFWGVGIITISLLAFIAFQLVYPTAKADESLNFLFLQAEQLSTMFGQIIGTLFLLVAAIFLFTTQLGIYETTSRILTENLQIFSKTINDRFARSNIFYFGLWAQVIAAILITLFANQQPLQILILGTFFSAVSMFALAPLLFIFNRSKFLHPELRPTKFRQIMLVVTGIFFGVFVLVTLFGG